MKTYFTLAILFFTTIIFSQTTISGKVIDEKKLPIAAANVFIEGTYDGTSTDENGNFTFTTTVIGKHTISASGLSYENFKKIIDVANAKDLSITLLESVNTLDAVTISAGNLDSGEKARVSVLKSMLGPHPPLVVDHHWAVPEINPFYPQYWIYPEHPLP